ncbi:MAG: tRNA dimethylallyltransferase [Parcubacteria group bacterium Gr01-1014_70]|nr:MAG: tRNA dimethylallyltransferase [Parcubacteria group bacterium Gr01-1014_70]
MANHQKPKLVAIVGPTASGKSELAVFIAQQIKKYKWGGYERAEIISADSRQVYKHLDVGTNKVPGIWQDTINNSKTNKHITLYLFAIAKRYALHRKRRIFIYKNIPHHCIDFVHPKKTFTVAEYKTCAKKAIQEITARGNLPILVGGTGFYIEAVINDILLPNVPPNLQLRKELEKKSVEELFMLLRKLDLTRAATIDVKNKRRLMRAIEIAIVLGKVPASKKHPPYTTLIIGIKKTDAELKNAIAKRSRKQIPGLLLEIKRLTRMKVPQKRIRELGFEYRSTLAYLETGRPSLLGRPVSKLELVHMLVKENWRYAKRQMTWFKRNKQIHWIEEKKDALELIRAFLK